MGSMDIQKISFLREKLRQLERETSSPFKPETGCCGLTLAQCHTLLEVGYRDDVSLVELAASIGLDASTLSRTIQGLVMLGLVNRLTNEQDRRCISISLTEQGRRAFSEIETTFNDYFGRVLELIPVEKREAVVDSVAAFSDAVKKYNESSGCCRPAPVERGPGEK
jgi:DNA-binding MarR family transcriptional regulator